MLALTRKQGESITITLPDGRAIVVEVVTIHPGAIKIGVEAPTDIKILRTELIGQRP